MYVLQKLLVLFLRDPFPVVPQDLDGTHGDTERRSKLVRDQRNESSFHLIEVAFLGEGLREFILGGSQFRCALCHACLQAGVQFSDQLSRAA